MGNSTTYFKSNPIKPSVAGLCQRPRVLPPRRQFRLSFYETPDPMKKISGRRKFQRRVKSAGTGGSVQGHTAFGVGLCSKAKERISGPSRASEWNAGPVGKQPSLSLRGAVCCDEAISRPRLPRSLRSLAMTRAALATTTRQSMGWRNEGGEDLGPLAGGEDQISELSGVL